VNALLAGIFVTSAWFFLAAAAWRGRHKWPGVKWGLVLYALGTFTWSLKGYELGMTGLMVISALQTVAVIVGVMLL
jgi:hypothetical protein